MKIQSLKLAGALFASIAMICTGPAWSAGTPNKRVKAVAKHKVKAKAGVKHRAKVRPVAMASAVVASAAIAADAVPAVAATVPAAATTTEPRPQAGYNPDRSQGNPYLAYQQPMAAVSPWGAANPPADTVQSFSPGLPSGLKSLLPSWPEGQSILPTFKKVYPTGEKPLVVVTFKCPTELIGVTPVPTKMLHNLVDGGMNVVNATDLLSFNLQQVCQ
jgi:hypothetical protein